MTAESAFWRNAKPGNTVILNTGAIGTYFGKFYSLQRNYSGKSVETSKGFYQVLYTFDNSPVSPKRLLILKNPKLSKIIEVEPELDQDTEILVNEQLCVDHSNVNNRDHIMLTSSPVSSWVVETEEISDKIDSGEIDISDLNYMDGVIAEHSSGRYGFVRYIGSGSIHDTPIDKNTLLQHKKMRVVSNETKQNMGLSGVTRWFRTYMIATTATGSVIKVPARLNFCSL
jgi:hypothetical protein